MVNGEVANATLLALAKRAPGACRLVVPEVVIAGERPFSGTMMSKAREGSGL